MSCFGIRNQFVKTNLWGDKPCWLMLGQVGHLGFYEQKITHSLYLLHWNGNTAANKKTRTVCFEFLTRHLWAFGRFWPVVNFFAPGVLSNFHFEIFRCPKVWALPGPCAALLGQRGVAQREDPATGSRWVRTVHAAFSQKSSQNAHKCISVPKHFSAFAAEMLNTITTYYKIVWTHSIFLRLSETKNMWILLDCFGRADCKLRLGWIFFKVWSWLSSLVVGVSWLISRYAPVICFLPCAVAMWWEFDMGEEIEEVLTLRPLFEETLVEPNSELELDFGPGRAEWEHKQWRCDDMWWYVRICDDMT